MPKKKTQFDVLTIFPKMIDSYAGESILGRAQKHGLIEIKSHNLRDWAEGKHKQVDDTPYGGGAGMVMKVEPFDKAVMDIKESKGLKGVVNKLKGKSTRVIMTAASGKPFTQKDAQRLAKFDQVIFLCGRYEGVDHRVEEHIADESFSIGDYVLTGGELPALVMIDAIARNVPGVLGAEESLKDESHNREGELEYPQYTKPETYRSWRVPDVLLSGNHVEIEKWRNAQRTQNKN